MAQHLAQQLPQPPNVDPSAPWWEVAAVSAGGVAWYAAADALRGAPLAVARIGLGALMIGAPALAAYRGIVDARASLPAEVARALAEGEAPADAQPADAAPSAAGPRHAERRTLAAVAAGGTVVATLATSIAVSVFTERGLARLGRALGRRGVPAPNTLIGLGAGAITLAAYRAIAAARRD